MLFKLFIKHPGVHLSPFFFFFFRLRFRLIAATDSRCSPARGNARAYAAAQHPAPRIVWHPREHAPAYCQDATYGAAGPPEAKLRPERSPSPRGLRLQPGRLPRERRRERGRGAAQGVDDLARAPLAFPTYTGNLAYAAAAAARQLDLTVDWRASEVESAAFARTPARGSGRSDR